MGRQVNRPRLTRREVVVMTLMERHDVNIQQFRAFGIRPHEVNRLLRTKLLMKRPGPNGSIFKPVYSWRDYAPL